MFKVFLNKNSSAQDYLSYGKQHWEGKVADKNTKIHYNMYSNASQKESNVAEIESSGS